MADTPETPPPILGFLTVLQEASGWLGGYLLTNNWGRPLEFRMTTVVQPNRVQRALYGPTLEEYVTVDLIGKTLVEKTAQTPALLLTDVPLLLGLRRRLRLPIVAVLPAEPASGSTPAGSTPAGSTPAGSTPAGSTPAGSTPAERTGSTETRPGMRSGLCGVGRLEHPRCPQGLLVAEPATDAEAVRAILDQLEGGLDLAEPFGRIREAIAEARKMGVSHRVA